VDLLSGRLADDVMRRLARPGDGMFPGPREVKVRRRHGEASQEAAQAVDRPTGECVPGGRPLLPLSGSLAHF
jgi:hypothetical protein